MKEGDLDGAVEASVADVAKVLSDPAAAEELRSSKGRHGKSRKVRYPLKI